MYVNMFEACPTLLAQEGSAMPYIHLIFIMAGSVPPYIFIYLSRGLPRPIYI